MLFGPLTLIGVSGFTNVFWQL